MSKKEESLEVKIARAVKTIYLNRMGNDFDFIAHPTLNEDVFRQCFAIVAHQHGTFYHKDVLILNQEQQDDRRRYVAQFKTARRRLQQAIRNLERNEAKRRVQIRRETSSPQPPVHREPEQLWLRGYRPVTPIPPAVAKKLAELRKG